MHYAATKEFTAEMGDRPGVQNIMVVVTDGLAKDKPEMSIEKIGKMLRDDGTIHVMAVGVNKAKTSELATISTAHNLIHESKQFSGLKSLLPAIFQGVCEETGGDAIAKTEPVPVTVSPVPEMNCDMKNANECNNEINLAIMLDSHHSVKRVDTEWQKYFAKMLIQNFEIS